MQLGTMSYTDVEVEGVDFGFCLQGCDMVEDCAVGYGRYLDRFSYDCDFVMVFEYAGGIEGGEQGVHVVFGLGCRIDDVL